MDAQIFSSIVGGCRGVSSLTLNCLLLNDSLLVVFLGKHLQELNLLCCSLMLYQVLAHVIRVVFLDCSLALCFATIFVLSG
ncbi:hypothetical protein RchiOBHm_Chr1g0356981 [Rosa chinensis]|uniref:F-box/LRR-repeat protein 15-like leucin rich repeat domain-containing protein n=1 Tax=Rosa chinensis TaxID=74649 RepID=A0A2P6SHR8_ROSCH|nr:hypothetical protein RchiOBHm_Chr1g0356981 [Rosa chinensis]